MKREHSIVGIIILIATSILLSAADSPSLIQPGSVDDPVITKSYFDQSIEQRVKDSLGNQSITEDKVRQLISDELAKQTPAQSGGNTSGAPATGTGSTLTIIKLEAGQSLYGGSGTEFIVRTGKTVVFSSDESGIADVTIGKDITAGQAVELNHLLIVPREGRGIKPDPKNNQEIYVMIRGGYLHTNGDGSKVSP